MTDQELSAAQSLANELDTKANDLRSAAHDGIEAAFAINAKVRDTQLQLRAVEKQSSQVRQVIKAELNARAETARLAAAEAAKQRPNE